MTIANLPCFCPMRLMFLDIPVQDKYFISLHISGASRFNNYKLWNYLVLQMCTDTLEGFRETTQKELEPRGTESICSCHCLEGDATLLASPLLLTCFLTWLQSLIYIPRVICGIGLSIISHCYSKQKTLKIVQELQWSGAWVRAVLTAELSPTFTAGIADL